ncbi:MAG: VWA domain-containing protein [Pyrinomonadaceae bacterium]
MKLAFLNRKTRVRRGVTFVLASVFALVLLTISQAGRAQQPGDSRPRRTEPAQQPAASPLPKATASPTPKPAPTRRPGVFVPELTEPPPPPVLKPKPSPTPDMDIELKGDDVIKFNTQLVTLNVRVIDRNNRPIDNVQQDEFKVYEDGTLQPIFSFTKEDVPISYGLAVDTSGSLRSQLPTVIDAAKTIINSNKPGDETFLVRFISSDKIETVQDFTPNKDLLIDGLDTLFTEGGQTALIDAVYLSAERVGQYKKGSQDDRRRRALIVVTDGEDRNSYFKQDQLFARLREEDVQIYVIGFVAELDKEGGLIRKSPRERSVALLNRLATDTGGRAFFPQSIAELPEIAGAIVRDLRTQYVISYSPTNTTQDGSYRGIKVTVADASGKDKRIALTRAGRTAVREGTPGTRPPTTQTNPPARQTTAPAATRRSP